MQTGLKSRLACWKRHPEPLILLPVPAHQEGCSGAGEQPERERRVQKQRVAHSVSSFTFLLSNPCGRCSLSYPLPALSAAMYLMEEGSLRQAGAQALQHHYKALLHGRLFVCIDLVYGYIVCHWISLKTDAKLIII